MPDPQRKTLGYLACGWCRDLWDRQALATVRENSKGKLFVVCEGGPDGDKVSCGQGNNLHARHSARLKALLAKAERGVAAATPAVEPAASPDQDTSDGTDDRAGADGEPATEPEPDAESKRVSFL